VELLQNIEPFYGWLGFYSHEMDENSPFHTVEHNLFEYDRFVYTFAAHPLWDQIESESLLVKILYANYDEGYAIVELLGEWNDLHLNDFKLLCENCLTYLTDAGIRKIILIAENVFNIYLGDDDYYEAFSEELEDGWMALLRARPHVQTEMRQYGIDKYFYWNPAFDDLTWRKLKPWQLFKLVEESMQRLLK
jgi:hypothetical protein